MLWAVVSICEAALPAGTLTQNKMAASRLWVAGQEVDIGALNGHSSQNGATPHGLEPQTLSMLVEGVALNSTAELRENGSAPLRKHTCSDICLLVTSGCIGLDWNFTVCFPAHMRHKRWMQGISQAGREWCEVSCYLLLATALTVDHAARGREGCVLRATDSVEVKPNDASE